MESVTVLVLRQFHFIINGVVSVDMSRRLQFIKQLSHAYVVYPSAIHTRFEHSLGTTHVSNIMANELGFSKQEDIEKIRLANSQDVFVILTYNSNSWRHFAHLALSSPGEPRMNILPITLQIGHIPVVAFFGPVRIIFCVFLRPINKSRQIDLLIFF